jgi:hypothetical protein
MKGSVKDIDITEKSARAMLDKSKKAKKRESELLSQLVTSESPTKLTKKATSSDKVANSRAENSDDVSSEDD